MDPLTSVIQGETEGPNLVGSTPSQVPQGIPPSPAEDSPYSFGIQGSPITTDDTLREKMALDALRPSIPQMVQDSIKSDWALSWAYQEMGDLSPAGPPVTEEAIQNFMSTTPNRYWELVPKAQSLAHLEKLRQFALDDAEREKRFAAAGYTGLGVRLLTSLFDPTAIGITAATEGVAAPYIAAMKVGKIAKLGLHALAGGVSNASLELVNQHVNPKTSEYAVGEAFGIGLIFGGTYGILRRHPSLQDEANGMNRLGSDMVKKAQARMSGVGAADNAQYISPLDLSQPQITADVPRSAKAAVRFDETANLGGNKYSKIANLVAPHIGEEGVGLTNHAPVAISASERGAQLHRSLMLPLRNGTSPQWTKWAKDMGVPVYQRLLPGARYREFQRLVYDAIENPAPLPGQYHPAVLAAAEHHRKFYATYANFYQNPGSPMGRTMRPIAGAENLAPDPHYVPKIMDPTKVNALIVKHGIPDLQRLVRGAILADNPHFDRDFVQRMAVGYVDNISKAAYGIDDGFGAAFRAQTKESMRGNLKAIGLDDELIDEIVARFTKPDSVGDTRLHRRTPLNYRFSVQTSKGELSMSDFFVTDAEELANRYSRKASGKVALAQIQVRNPDNDELLIDGITSAAEWEKLGNHIKSEMASNGLAGTDGRFKSTVESLNFFYKAITGSPLHGGQNYVPWLRRLGSYNVIRLMNRMGLNQMQEVGLMVTQVGIKAMASQMPTFRRIINGDVSEWSNKLANELESWGVLGDPNFSAERFAVLDEMVGEAGGQTWASRVGARIDNGLVIGKSVTSNISLMRPINSMLQQWTARSIVQRFADMANGVGLAGLKGSDKDRMAQLGLSPEMLDRVFGQVKRHSTMDGKKLSLMNLENWDDKEAAHQFIGSVSRYTRRVVMENDAGSLHRWMSNPAAKLFFQFRSFVFGAWAKRTLYNLHHIDMTTFSTAMAEVMLGATTWAINAHVNAPNQKDPEKYLEDQLSIRRLATAGVARSGIASFLPAVSDTVTTFLGQGAYFDARTSGTAADFWLGAPYVDLPKSMTQGFGGLVDSFVDGRPLAREEANAIARSLPWGNSFGMPALLGYMMKDNPYRAPRAE